MLTNLKCQNTCLDSYQLKIKCLKIEQFTVLDVKSRNNNEIELVCPQSII